MGSQSNLSSLGPKGWFLTNIHYSWQWWSLSTLFCIWSAYLINSHPEHAEQKGKDLGRLSSCLIWAPCQISTADCAWQIISDFILEAGAGVLVAFVLLVIGEVPLEPSIPERSVQVHQKITTPWCQLQHKHRAEPLTVWSHPGACAYRELALGSQHGFPQNKQMENHLGRLILSCLSYFSQSTNSAKSVSLSLKLSYISQAHRMGTVRFLRWQFPFFSSLNRLIQHSMRLFCFLLDQMESQGIMQGSRSKAQSDWCKNSNNSPGPIL
jgi:hypothetical protein